MFSGKLMKWEEILYKIQRYVNDLFIAHKIKLPKGSISLDCMEFFKLSAFHMPIKIKLITWQRPRLQWVKLNVDGAYKGNPRRAGGGCTFRNSHGNLLLDFYEFFGQGTSMSVNAMALFCGLLLAKELAVTFL